MNICILNTLFPPNIVGGAEKSVSLLAAAYAQEGHSVCVISLHEVAEARIQELKGVRVYYLPLQNIYWPFQTSKKPPALKRLWWHINDIWNHKAAKMVGAILDKEKPDVLHTNNITGFSIAVWWEAKKRKIRLVHTLRDYSLLCPRGTLFNKGRQCTTRCASCVVMAAPRALVTHWVDEVIAVSKYALNEHTKRGYFKSCKQNVVFNIADVSPVRMQPIVKNANSEVIFGFLGRVEDEKGISMLLDACAQLPKTGWRLKVAGSGRDAYVAQLKDKYAHLPIDWLGFVDTEVLFDNINLLVVPSIWPEPLSRTVIESAARGVPVLLSDAGGQPELVSMGIPGVVYPSMDVAALAAHLINILNQKGPFFNSNLTQGQQLDWAEKLSAATVTTSNMATYK